MRGYHDLETDSPQPAKYMVCVGGYPRETARSLAEAEARAWDLARIEPDADWSVYEVETGIHFDIFVPGLDEGVMTGVFDAFFERVHQMR